MVMTTKGGAGCCFEHTLMSDIDPTTFCEGVCWVCVCVYV